MSTQQLFADALSRVSLWAARGDIRDSRLRLALQSQSSDDLHAVKFDPTLRMPEGYVYWHDWMGRRFRIDETFGDSWLDYVVRRTRPMTSDAQTGSRLAQGLRRAAATMLVLHEFLHVSQDLSSHRHNDIERAPEVLRAVDYAADALSIRALVEMAEDPSVNDALGDVFADLSTDASWPHRLARLIDVQLAGMEGFEFSGARGAKPTRVGRGQFHRYLTWHYQLHRARLFHPDRSPHLFHLDALPALDVRGLRPREFKENDVGPIPPPFQKLGGEDPPFCWIGALNLAGVPTVYRGELTDPSKGSGVFRAIVEADPSQSRPAFDEILSAPGNVELVGRLRPGTMTGHASGGGSSDSLDTLRARTALLRMSEVRLHGLAAELGLDIDPSEPPMKGPRVSNDIPGSLLARMQRGGSAVRVAIDRWAGAEALELSYWLGRRERSRS